MVVPNEIARFVMNLCGQISRHGWDLINNDGGREKDEWGIFFATIVRVFFLSMVY
jgi:hypothetical protein